MKSALAFIKRVMSLLEGKHKKELIRLYLMSAFASVIDVLGLASVIPLILAALDPANIQDKGWWKSLANFTGTNDYKDVLLGLMLLVLLVFIIKNIFAIWVQKMQAKFAFSQAARFTSVGLNALMQKDYLAFKKRESGELLSQTISIPDAFSRNILMGFSQLFSEGFVMLIIVIGLIAYDPLLLLFLAISLIPVFFIFYYINRNKSKSLGELRNKVSENILQDSLQFIRGFTSFKLSQDEDFITNKISAKRQEVAAINAELDVIYAYPIRLIEIISILGIAVLFVYGLYFSTSNSLLTFLSLYAAAAYRLMPSSNRLLNGILKLKTFRYTIGILEHFKKLSDERNELLGDQKSIKRFELNKSIELKNVDFSYGEAVVINSLNLFIEKGKITGISGDSGSGKSTLLLLILQLIEQQKGEVIMDGIAIVKGNKRAYQKSFAYVGQEVFILQDTIKNNICFGREGADDEKVLQALKDAALSEWLSQQSNGLDTKISEDGQNLSGGQKQRLAIARALYNNTSILVMDEATSALDRQAEKNVLDSIQALANKGYTIVLSSHRESTLAICDKVISL